MAPDPRTGPPQAGPPQAVPPQAVPPQAVPPQAVPPHAVSPHAGPPRPTWLNATRLITLCLVVVVLLAAGVSALKGRIDLGGDGPRVERPAVEPRHVVVYRFATNGTANDDIRIEYTDADGDTESLSLPGVVPAWRHQVRTPRGLTAVALSVTARSSDANYRIRCAVEIDGYVEEEMESIACAILVHFPRPSRERTRAQPPVTASATRTAAPLPAGCRLASPAEVTGIVLRAAGGVPKPVQSVEGDTRRCRYWIDVDRGYVEYTWFPGRRDPGLPVNWRVADLGVRAYWQDYGGRSGRLHVFPSGGELRVDVHFEGLTVDAKAAALAIARTALPRLR
jgi:hypothetical protein